MPPTVSPRPRRRLALLTPLLLLALTACPSGPTPGPERGIGGVAQVGKVRDKSEFVRSARGYALVVGISDYADPGIPDLRYAHRDAFAWRDFLLSAEGGAFQPARVKCLVNEQATRVNIISSISGFLNAAGPEDLVFVFFAGHGTPEQRKKTIPYLLCYDSVPGKYAATAIEMTDLKKKLEDYVNSQRVILIADACHSAGTEGWQQGVRAASGDVAEYWKKLASSEQGRSIVTASRVGELSREDERWGGGHGVFTYYVLQALRGEADARGRTADRNGDGFVTLGEAFDWAQPKVLNDTQYTQHPYGGAYVDDSIPLGVLDRATLQELERAARPAETPPEAAEAKLEIPASAVAMPELYAGRLTEDQGTFNHAAMLYERGQTDAAMQKLDALIRAGSPVRPRAMLARLGHLLKLGEYGSARSVGLEIQARYPGSADAAQARLRLDALDAAYARAEYNAVLERTGRDQALPARIQALQQWLAEQERLPQKDRNPHIPDAQEQILEWQATIRKQRLARYQRALNNAQRKLDGDEPAAAILALKEARLHTDDTTEVDRLLKLAEAKLVEKGHRDTYAAAAERARAARSPADRIAVWVEYLRANAESPLAPQAAEELDRLKASLCKQLEADYQKAVEAADKARAGKRFAEALVEVTRARKLVADGRRWGFEIAAHDADVLDKLEQTLKAEEKAHGQQAAWLSASRAAHAEIAGVLDEKAYDRAIGRLQSFIDRHPDNPRVADARARIAELRPKRDGYVRDEIQRRRTAFDETVTELDGLAKKGDAKVATGVAARARSHLARLRDLGDDAKHLGALESRLDKALTGFAPRLALAATTTRDAKPLACEIYIDGKRQTAKTPVEYRLERDREYRIELRAADHEPYTTTFRADHQGLRRIEAKLKWTGGTFLFKETFSDNSGNWSAVNTADSTFAVRGGRYVLKHSGTGGRLAWKAVPMGADQDFLIESTMRHVAGSDVEPFGLVWGLKDVNSLYFYEYSARGGCVYGKRTGDKWINWRDWFDVAAWRRGADNRLGIFRGGRALYFLLNDAVVAAAWHEPHFGPNVGFRVQGTQTVDVDDLTVKRVRTLLNEDFADNRNKWHVVDDAAARLTVGKGRYVLWNKSATQSYLSWRGLDVDPDKDFLIEAEMRRVTGNRNSGFGVIWDVKDAGEYRILMTDGNSQFAAGHWTGGKYNWWKPWTRHAAVQAEKTNRIVILKSGKRLSLLIGQTPVLTVPWAGLRNKRWGFLLGSNQTVEVTYCAVRGVR
jgi:hypothetical protein